MDMALSMSCAICLFLASSSSARRAAPCPRCGPMARLGDKASGLETMLPLRCLPAGVGGSIWIVVCLGDRGICRRFDYILSLLFLICYPLWMSRGCESGHSALSALVGLCNAASYAVCIGKKRFQRQRKDVKRCNMRYVSSLGL